MSGGPLSLFVRGCGSRRGRRRRIGALAYNSGIAFPAPIMFARLPLYLRLVRMDKPIGSLLLLWPTLNALWIASDGRPPVSLLVIFVIGTVLMRSAGCAINDYADRDFDRHVERTANRPLARGEIAPWEALAVATAFATCAFLLLIPLNNATKLLALPALGIAIAYPF